MHDQPAVFYRHGGNRLEDVIEHAALEVEPLVLNATQQFPEGLFVKLRRELVRMPRRTLPMFPWG